MSSDNNVWVQQVLAELLIDEGEGLTAGSRLWRCPVCWRGWQTGGTFPVQRYHDVNCIFERFAALVGTLLDQLNEQRICIADLECTSTAQTVSQLSKECLRVNHERLEAIMRAEAAEATLANAKSDYLEREESYEATLAKLRKELESKKNE